jgi:hypothetical protein
MVEDQIVQAQRVQLFNYWFGRLVIRNGAVCVGGLLGIKRLPRYELWIFFAILIGVLLNSIPMVFPVMCRKQNIFFFSGWRVRRLPKSQLVVGAERTKGLVNQPVRLVLCNSISGKRFPVSSILAPNLSLLIRRELVAYPCFSDVLKRTAIVAELPFARPNQFRCLFGNETVVPTSQIQFVELFSGGSKTSLNLAGISESDEYEGVLTLGESEQRPKFGSSIVFGPVTN